MVKVLNLYEAKTQLSALVERAAAGEDMVIAKAGRPRAKLVAVGPAVGRRARPRDPFDRMLVAQAMVEGATLVTRDSALGAYGVPVLW